MTSSVDPRVREALEELDSYLADNLPPLLVADSIEVLLELDPGLTAEELRTWAVTQFRARGGAMPVSDLLFHALKKVQVIEELELLPPERFAAFVVALGRLLVEACPPGERDRLLGMLRYLNETRVAHEAAVERLHRAPVSELGAEVAASGPAAVAPLSAAELQNLRRYSVLLERVLPGGKGEVSGDTAELARHLLVVAAAGSGTPQELAARLQQLHRAGATSGLARDLVRSLTVTIPDWVVRRGEGIEVYRGESVEAVRRAVRLAGDRHLTAERWKDLLRSAAEHFNQGAYGRAVTLIELADRMVRENEVDARVAEIARGSGHEAFDTARLLEAAAEPQHRPVLRRLFEFFPAWSVRELLEALDAQPDPKRRRLLLTQLEVWGAPARPAVLERLGTAIATGSRDPNAWWFLRNLVYLLHRLPRVPGDDDPRRELELVAPYSTLGSNHPSFQRETFLLLGGLPGGMGAPLLEQRLAAAERALEGNALPPHDLPDMWRILNTLAAGLARTGVSSARQALARHALAQRPRAGDSAARLRELARTDLAGDGDTVDLLLEAVRTLQPVKVLGFTVHRNEETLAHVVRALSATTEPRVRRALAELAERFPDREFGRLAAGGTVEEAIRPAAESEELELAPEPNPVQASLAGDLEVFGLAGLLQNLQQSEASGRLLLRDAGGRERARFELARGNLAGCSCGDLRGEAAFYQVFELPAPGTFEFARAAGTPPARATLDPAALLLEAMRRFDELQRARVVVPDHAFLRAGEARPTPRPGEADGDLVRRLWTRVRGGAIAQECDAEGGVDLYRIRALLAHWVEEGALTVASDDRSTTPTRLGTERPAAG